VDLIETSLTMVPKLSDNINNKSFLDDDLPVDGGPGAAEVAGYLPVGRAAAGLELLEGPAFKQWIVKYAVGVGAEGRLPAGLMGFDV
jgi:hypothetical protein